MTFPTLHRDVVVRFRGRLGNQLFQYCTALALSRRIQANLWVEPASAPFEIEALVTLNPAPQSVLESTLGPLGWRGTVFRWVQGLLPVPVRRFRQDLFGSFLPDILRASESTFLDGYWQSFLYFDGLVPEDFDAFRKQIARKAGDDPWLAKARSAVVLHVRRTDYVVIGAALPESFYHEALKRFPGKPVLVVTDDPEFCRQAFSAYPNVEIVTDLSRTAWQDLNLLIHANSIIAANSTYSWWGAFLNEGVETVVVPNCWFSPEPSFVHNLDQVYPQGWIRI